ncbi:MAG: hypothetical protein EAZ77_03885 [Nostocales cyanobacterium]|nr:MAG: hypothetical protein EAZ77_03885 [Nostocales cyanobacterium]
MAVRSWGLTPLPTSRETRRGGVAHQGSQLPFRSRNNCKIWNQQIRDLIRIIKIVKVLFILDFES